MSEQGGGAGQRRSASGSSVPPVGGRASRATRSPARAAALAVLDRVDPGGAYANLALGPELSRSGLGRRDRNLVTEMVYGTTRMRRACDHLVDRFLIDEVAPTVRNALRLGAYQLRFMAVPAHAAVSETVAVTPRRARGLVNAVLRRVADSAVQWPDEATRLSYPDWIVSRLAADLGPRDAAGAMETMNLSPPVTVRPDGYVQDQASSWVARAVGAGPGQRVLDLCAAPGGKASALAGMGATVVAVDLRISRLGLVADAAARTATTISLVAADGACPPFVPASFDRVLVDAPCSGLGALRRRPDARWRMQPEAVDRLAGLQRRLVDAAAELVRPGGRLVYSVCTLTSAETVAVDRHLAEVRPDLEAVGPGGGRVGGTGGLDGSDGLVGPWRASGRGALVLPQDAGTDGMFVLRLERRI